MTNKRAEELLGKIEKLLKSKYIEFNGVPVVTDESSLLYQAAALIREMQKPIGLEALSAEEKYRFARNIPGPDAIIPPDTWKSRNVGKNKADLPTSGLMCVSGTHEDNARDTNSQVSIHCRDECKQTENPIMANNDQFEDTLDMVNEENEIKSLLLKEENVERVAKEIKWENEEHGARPDSWEELDEHNKAFLVDAAKAAINEVIKVLEEK